ncbi:hypothetical protein GLOTRDRAFT_129458 [Gloeophyllum trabeum ATCC 11539]|uniref:F-box domain-containing protein n=1 Tax=Gloeophyllum trabeum (strain ATCC 11539 / FP-39264 / Madison 617) TaxID=670483 RepID=S7Q556_GLOTA|nr:uncharacterized protein GLOTRDRAFT_129458 [Gloeophyllum trabeum ATCC 11539]EPQ55166.1 hypothetical protein GLOTRDRAFT_129458 [Gloeophyllum trabeum ATCC 11539]
MSVNEWVSLSDPLGRAISWQIIPLIKSLESTHCQSLSLEERQCWIPEQTLYASAPKLEAAIKALRPLTTLTSLTLSIPLLFARDFRSWTVQTMNLSPLQYLRIEDWTTEAGSWGVVFEFLRLKHLQKLELSVCNLPAPSQNQLLPY